MEEHRCEVRIWGPSKDCPNCSGKPIDYPGGCERCQIGCFKIARFHNRTYDPEGHSGYSGIYNYCEWLCAEHYDEQQKGSMYED